jgi:hypothetical protein
MYQIQNTLERHRLRAQPPDGVWMPQVTLALEHGWPAEYADAGIEATCAFCVTLPAQGSQPTFWRTPKGEQPPSPSSNS